MPARYPFMNFTSANSVGDLMNLTILGNRVPGMDSAKLLPHRHTRWPLNSSSHPDRNHPSRCIKQSATTVLVQLTCALTRKRPRNQAAIRNADRSDHPALAGLLNMTPAPFDLQRRHSG